MNPSPARRPDPVVEAAGPRILRELTRPWSPDRGAVVLAAVSGGADSVALLRLLAALAPGRGWTVVAASLDHGLRGAAGADDLRFVERLTASLGLELAGGRLDAPPRGEAAARGARRAFLERIAREHRAAAIAVAHTMDDQAETVLQRLARGTGLAGLAAMRRWSPPWWRPLLGVRRSALRSLLRTLGQPWREDETNLAPDQLRARLRARVLPALEAAGGAGAIPALARAARLAAEDDALLAELAAARLAEIVVSSGRGRIACSLGALRALPTPLARRIVRRLVAAISAGRVRAEADHVDAVLHLLDPTCQGTVVDLPEGLRVRRAAGLITFAKAPHVRGEPGKGADR